MLDWKMENIIEERKLLEAFFYVIDKNGPAVVESTKADLKATSGTVEFISRCNARSPAEC
jgi:hypothetical protein